MTIFNKRNALVGFVTLKALERRRQQKKRHMWKLAGFLALGIVSAGILAAVAAVVLRRQKSDSEESEETQRLEGYAVGDNGGLDPTAFDVELPEPSSAA